MGVVVPTKTIPVPLASQPYPIVIGAGSLANLGDLLLEQKLKAGTKVLVVNALRYEDHYSHFTIGEALELIADVKPELAYFTHMSHQFGLHAETETKLPANVKVAYDGLKINV
jgi:phosphoribosyl 1,2-cyclic phosphodiesterase